jgi:phosphoribosylformylglycinamidine synthase
MYKGIHSGKILAAHDVSEGGLITTLFEMCLGGACGAVITIRDKNPETILFNETAGTFLVEVTNEKTASQLFKTIPYTILGNTQKEKTITVKNLFNIKVADLTKAWKEPMRKYFP